MNISTVTKDILKVSVNIENVLFESMWEMPYGVSLNSYIVKGKETAIIDGVGNWNGVPEKFLKLLNTAKIDPKTISYVIINHVEPDHSGWLLNLEIICPSVKVLCSKAKICCNHIITLNMK